MKTASGSRRLGTLIAHFVLAVLTTAILAARILLAVLVGLGTSGMSGETPTSEQLREEAFSNLMVSGVMAILFVIGSVVAREPGLWVGFRFWKWVWGTIAAFLLVDALWWGLGLPLPPVVLLFGGILSLQDPWGRFGFLILLSVGAVLTAWRISRKTRAGTISK